MSKISIRFSLFLFCIIYLSAEVKSQSDFIVSTQGDTIYGKIENRGDILNSKSVTFLRNETKNNRTFYPKDIDSYSIAGYGVYKTFRALNASEEQYLFFKEIVNGDIKLYSITKRLDQGDTSNLNYLGDVIYEFFFIQSIEGELLSLTPDKVSYDLQNILTNCRDQSFLRRLNDSNISKKELANIVVDYNLCIDPNSDSKITDQTLITSPKAGTTSFGFRTSFNSTNFLYTEVNSLSNNFDYSNYNYIGIGLFYSRKVTKHFDFTFELNYEEKGYSSENPIIVSEFYENEGEEILLQSSSRLKLIQVPFYASYMKRFDKLSFNIDFGASAGLVLNEDFKFEETIFIQESNKDYLVKREVPFVHQTASTFETSFLTGIGLTYNFGSFNISLGTRIKTGFLNIQTYKNSTLSTYIGIGFNK